MAQQAVTAAVYCVARPCYQWRQRRHAAVVMLALHVHVRNWAAALEAMGGGERSCRQLLQTHFCLSRASRLQTYDEEGMYGVIDRHGRGEYRKGDGTAGKPFLLADSIAQHWHFSEKGGEDGMHSRGYY